MTVVSAVLQSSVLNAFTKVGGFTGWLIVKVEQEPQPVVSRVIKEGWSVACDEVRLSFVCQERRVVFTSSPSSMQRSMTMLMQRGDPEARAKATVQKLRFASLPDFWAFVAQVAASRVHASACQWNSV